MMNLHKDKEKRDFVVDLNRKNTIFPKMIRKPDV